MQKLPSSLAVGLDSIVSLIFYYFHAHQKLIKSHQYSQNISLSNVNFYDRRRGLSFTVVFPIDGSLTPLMSLSTISLSLSLFYFYFTANNSLLPSEDNRFYRLNPSILSP